MRLNFEKRGTGSEVLLLGHGFPFDHTMWKHQLDGLSDEFTVLAVDFRGMGQSPASGNVQTSMGELADDLAHLLDVLNVERCTYCGLSMGGYVGLEFWKRHPKRLARLILCDTNAHGDSPEGAAKRLETAAKIESEGTCAFLVEAMKRNLMTDATIQGADRPDGVFALYQKMVSQNPPNGVAAVARGMAQRADFTAELSKIAIPVLVLTGALDILSPPKAMNALAESFPKAEFRIIPDAAHLAPMENPELVNKFIRQFLKKTA